MYKLTRNIGLVLLALAIAPPLSTGQADFIWWEGEQPSETNFPPRTSFSAATFTDKRELLSGGAWLTNEGVREGKAGYAKYELSVREGGDYKLWARKFWKHGPFRWRFDDVDWSKCGADIALADECVIRTHLCANWVYLGEVNLTAGEHSFELRLLAEPGEAQTACFDAFVLTRGPFMPRGKLKPGEKYNRADAGWFPYEPELDRFTGQALLDLRKLNERQAGEHGFVRRQGEGFVLAGGEPVRFWGVNVNAEHAAADRSSVDYLARKLAKQGVNMVRYHSALFSPAGDPANIDKKKLDDLHYLVSAMRGQGIYTLLSFYFPLWFEIKPGYGIEGYGRAGNKIPFSLLYHEPRMQEIHRAWLEQILGTTNPYSGVPLSKEPALAIVEIINEDSYFFWTFSRENIPTQHWQRLERLFASWLAKRYGSLDGAYAAWGGAAAAEDRADGAEIFPAWHMTRDGLRNASLAQGKRIADQVRFLASGQRAYYRRTRDYIKGKLGYGGLVSASNWTTADPALLEAVEHYSYAPCDVMDRHGYFQGKHEGEGSAYSLRQGHSWQDLSALKNPSSLGPLQFFQVAGYPQIISELGWPNPNRYRADMTSLVAACASLQGVDGVFFFAVGNNFLNDQGMRKFQVGSPMVAGAFPAAALLYRLGYLKEGERVVEQYIAPQELFSLSRTSGAAAEALDELRKQDVAGATGQSAAIDPLSFFVGKVTRQFMAGHSVRRDLTGNIDRAKKTLKSSSGELIWDYGEGLLRINSWRAQGAAGFLRQAGAIELSHLVVESDNEYGSLLAVSLDGRPLESSRRILIQALTEERPFGFSGSAGVIEELGGAPLGVKRIAMRLAIRLKGTAPARVVALDENGYPSQRQVAVSGGGGQPLVIELDPESLYHLVIR